jgi:hypothetical protein
MRIVILVDLLRLQAHDERDAAGNSVSYAFGVSFAPSIQRDTDLEQIPPVFTGDLVNPADPDGARATLALRAGPLAPWCWDSVSIQVFKQDGTVVPAGDVTLISLPPTRDLSHDDLNTIEQKIVANCVQGAADSPNALTLPAQGNADLPPNDFCYPGFIQSAAAWPAPVPHGRFNFVKFFHVKASGVTGDKPWVVAIPTFSVGGETFNTATLVPPPLPPPPTNLITYNYSNTWNLAPINNVAVQACCAQCSIALPASTASFVDLTTLWVRAQNHLSGAPAISKDAWFEELPRRLERAFDLPNRLLDALGQRDASSQSRPPSSGSAAPPTPRSDLRQALIDQGSAGVSNTDKDRTKKIAANTAILATKLVLRGLHDCLGPVWVWNSQDSFNLFKTQGAVAQRLITLLPDVAANGTSLKDNKTNLLAALAQSLPDILKSERAPAQWDGDPAIKESPIVGNPWIARLAARLSAISDLPADVTLFLNVLKDTMVIDPNHPETPFQLDRLASVVAMATRPDILANLMVDTWSATQGPGSATALLQALELLVDVRGTLAQRGLILMRTRRGVLQPAWSAPDGLFQRPAVGQDKSDLELLRNNASAAFQSYGLGTLAAAGSAAAFDLEGSYEKNFCRTGLLLTDARRAALQNALSAEAQSALGTNLSDLSPASVLGLSEDEAPSPGTVIPGGVTIQFDRVIRGPQTPGAGSADDDFHQYLAGYGILVNLVNPANTSAAAQWRGLTVVNIGIGGPPGPLPPPLNDVSGKRIECVTPLTPVYDDEALPAAAVHYDNAPIVGAANIVRRALASDAGSLQINIDPVILPLQPRPGFAGEITGPLARLPFLAFGVGIQSASFVITNHGALPREIADPSFPALLSQAFSSPPDGAVAPGPTAPGAPLYTPYLRRVAVGALGMPETITAGYNAFSIDPAIRLLTDELVLSGQPDKPAIDLLDAGKRPMPRAVLLAGMVDRNNQPKNNQTQFAIRAPSVDIEVFDRWIAFDEFQAAGNAARQQKIRQYRKDLRDAFDQNSADLRKQKNDDSYSIGDPAVSLFYMRARCIFRNGVPVDSTTAPPENPIYLDWSLSLDALLANPAKPKGTHRPLQQITLKVVDSSTAPGLSKTPGVTLGVAEGEVWIADVFAGIDPDVVNARFDSAVLGKNPTRDSIDGKAYWLVSQFSFTVECATRDLPKPEEVYAAFVPGYLPADGNITFAWKREQTRAAAAVGAINVGWQQWRPTGRPPSPFPYDAIGNLDKFPPARVSAPLTYPILWDVEGFAERPEAPSQGRRFEPKLVPTQATGPELLASEAPSPAQPARYVRFEIAAESRYARLYDPPLRPVPGSITSGNWSTPWKRVFRPAMPTAVHALNVKAVVPLTRSVGEGSQNSLSGVLMVIDGAFGESGGIAENIEIRAVQIVRELQGTPQPVAATEFGADPILRAKALGRANASASFGADLRIVGPIGHTFDIGALAPAFQSTSFIVAPPDFAQQDYGAGWMVKLRARRVLDPRGVAGYGAITIRVPPPGSPPPDPVRLSGNGDLSLAFDNLPLAPGNTITIVLTADRAGSLPAGQSPPRSASMTSPTQIRSASTNLPQSWNLTLAASAAGTSPATTTISFGNVIVQVPGALAAVRFLVATRRLQRDNLPVDRFEATLEAIDTNGTIIRAGEIAFEDAPATGAVRLSVTTGGTDQTIPVKVLRAPLASDWVETGWTQFLPDTSVQMRDRFNVGPSTLKLTVQGTAIQVTATPPQATPPASMPTVAWCTFDGLANRKRQDDQGLVHFLLLTRVVPSFAGADEAYVGLYILKSGSENGTSAQFVPFGSPELVPLANDPGLRARLMVVQVDPRQWQSDYTTWFQKADRPWDAFFPSETTTGSQLADDNAPDALLSPRDAKVRILTVYAPFGS